jgi:hypothetical protein
MTATLRSAVKLGPDVPVNEMCAITAQISDSMFNARLFATLCPFLSHGDPMLLALRYK